MKGEVCGGQCTGSDESHIWKVLHSDLPKKFNCGTCAEHFISDMEGYHDLVSIRIGKEPQKVKAFEKFYDSVQCAHNHCVKMGWCKS